MSASQPISDQIQQHKQTWQELWYAMAKGDALAYKEIKSMNVFEFYTFFDIWREKIKQDLKNNNNGKR